MNKEDKEFLELCKDMGFWFDNVLGNEELLNKYYTLTQQREEELKNLELEQAILRYKEKSMFGFDECDLTDEKMLELINKDYADLVKLRNKLEYEIEAENVVEEDTQTCDHVLDDMELLVDILKTVLQKGDKE